MRDFYWHTTQNAHNLLWVWHCWSNAVQIWNSSVLSYKVCLWCEFTCCTAGAAYTRSFSPLSHNSCSATLGFCSRRNICSLVNHAFTAAFQDISLCLNRHRACCYGVCVVFFHRCFFFSSHEDRVNSIAHATTCGCCAFFFFPPHNSSSYFSEHSSNMFPQRLYFFK